MSKIAILYICTGKYDVFWEEFYYSFQENFLKDSLKDYFVFTDAESIKYEENENVHKIFQENLGWPGNTLKRFDIFMKISTELEKFDYIFFMNANALCVNSVLEKDFLPVDKELLAVQHPGFYSKKPDEYTYDRNPDSLAYIPYGQGVNYVCGGVNGGKAVAYLEMIKQLQQNVILDEEKDVVALWHDESHLNHYILGREDVLMLSPSYCYPEGASLPFEPKIVVREKSRYFNVNKIKGVKNTTPLILRCKIFVKKFLEKLGLM